LFGTEGFGRDDNIICLHKRLPLKRQTDKEIVLPHNERTQLRETYRVKESGLSVNFRTDR
ncbi:MAG: hypothetical protein Q7T50_06880, partial [Candidatus Magasanikbacteria bacterium]|nr:hypothetical protein [Candidatus Magasanikbacteria bacterium]